MQTLESWYRHNTIKPMLWLLFMVFISWTGIVCFQIISTQDQKTQKADDIAGLLQDSILKHNRREVEALVDSLFMSLDAYNVSICKNGSPILSRGYTAEHCVANEHIFPSRVEIHTLGGLKDFSLVVHYPLFFENSFLSTIAFGIILISGCILIVLRTSRRIYSDILSPLKEGNQNQNDLQIREVAQLLRSQQLALQNEVNQAKIATAQQVAHDVRSPLSALQIVASSLPNMPEEQSNILQKSIDRIANIVSDLDRSKSFTCGMLCDLELKSAIEEIVSEKRIHDSSGKYRFVCNLKEKTLPRVNPNEFKRVISNILNNAMEAMPNGGPVNIIFKENDSNSVLEITDHGKGISTEILPLLGNKKFTYGKQFGNGLGLYHAFNFFKSIGGEIKIESGTSQGTTVKLLF